MINPRCAARIRRREAYALGDRPRNLLAVAHRGPWASRTPIALCLEDLDAVIGVSAVDPRSIRWKALDPNGIVPRGRRLDHLGAVGDAATLIQASQSASATRRAITVATVNGDCPTRDPTFAVAANRRGAQVPRDTLQEGQAREAKTA